MMFVSVPNGSLICRLNLESCKIVTAVRRKRNTLAEAERYRPTLNSGKGGGSPASTRFIFMSAAFFISQLASVLELEIILG